MLTLAGPGAGQPVPPPLTVEQTADAIDKARDLVEKRRYDEALTVLRPLTSQRPGQADALFLTGLAGIGASVQPGMSEEARDALLDEAIAALRTVLVREPGLVRVRLELARAFFLKGEDGLATRHLEQVLAGEPPAGVVLNANRFLSLIRARKRWIIRVGAKLAPDSSIGAGSGEQIILIQGISFRRDQEELASSGLGISVWAGGEFQYPLEDRWRLRAGADISRREYSSYEFDRMFVSGHLGPRWLIERATEASLLASVRQSWLADEAEYRDLGLRVELHHRLDLQTTASLYAARHERRYDVYSHLDGPVTDISAGIGWVATPTMRVDAAMGWGRERTELERLRHNRRWLHVGATVILPWGFTVGGAGTLRWTDFQGDWYPFTADGSPRRDLTRSIRLDIYNRAITVGGFSPQVSVVQEKQATNAQVHNYERIFGELRFVRLF